MANLFDVFTVSFGKAKDARIAELETDNAARLIDEPSAIRNSGEAQPATRWKSPATLRLGERIAELETDAKSWASLVEADIVTQELSNCNVSPNLETDARSLS